MTLDTDRCSVSCMIAGSATPWRLASVTNPDRRLCPPKFPSSPAKRAQRCTISPTAAGDRVGPTRCFQSRRKMPPSVMPAASSQSCRAQASAANHKAELATAQTSELQRLTVRLEEQLKEVGPQRDAAIAKAADGETTRHTLEARIQSLQDAAQAERESFGLHVRAVEDRALSEIDRARQETKEAQGRLLEASRQAAAAEKSLREQIHQANLKTLEASRDSAAQRARADALGGQLGASGDLPAALEAAIRRSEARPKPRKSHSRAKVAVSKAEPKRQPSSPGSRGRRTNYAIIGNCRFQVVDRNRNGCRGMTQSRPTSWVRIRRQSLGTTDRYDAVTSQQSFYIIYIMRS